MTDCFKNLKEIIIHLKYSELIKSKINLKYQHNKIKKSYESQTRPISLHFTDTEFFLQTENLWQLCHASLSAPFLFFYLCFYLIPSS